MPEPMPTPDHNHNSVNREKLLEHLLIGELLRHAWLQGQSLEVLRPEVDAAGYDLVLACDGVFRHVQLKSSHTKSKTARVPVNIALADKPSGCVVWVRFDAKTLELTEFLFYGDLPGTKLITLHDCPVAKHTKGNAQGVKSIRPAIRSVKRGDFTPVQTIPHLVALLFDSCGDPSTSKKLIPDGTLRTGQIPKATADWEIIQKFALTCDGYKRRSDVGDFANDASSFFDSHGHIGRKLSLAEARDCLFFEQRRWRHYGKEPDEPAMRFIHVLLSTIRDAVRG